MLNLCLTLVSKKSRYKTHMFINSSDYSYEELTMPPWKTIWHWTKSTIREKRQVSTHQKKRYRLTGQKSSGSEGKHPPPSKKTKLGFLGFHFRQYFSSSLAATFSKKHFILWWPSLHRQISQAKVLKNNTLRICMYVSDSIYSHWLFLFWKKFQSNSLKEIRNCDSPYEKLCCRILLLFQNTLCNTLISLLKCGRQRGSNSSWLVFQVLKKSFLVPSKHKTYKLQKWLQSFLVSDSGLQANRSPPLKEGARQAPIPHPVVEPNWRLVIDGDGAIWSVPELGALIIQGKEVVTQRRDTWGKVKHTPAN